MRQRGDKGAILLDVVEEPPQLALPLLRWQPCVDGQVLHHIEITAHLVSQSCQQQSLCWVTVNTKDQENQTCSSCTLVMDVLQTQEGQAVVSKAFSCFLYIHPHWHRKNPGFSHLRGNHTRHCSSSVPFSNQNKTVLRWTGTASGKWVSWSKIYIYVSHKIIINF